MENKKDQKITTPMAIIIAGVFIALAVLITKGQGVNNDSDNTPKTPSQQLGVSKEQLLSCLEKESENIYKEIEADLALLLDGQEDECGTPFSILIDKNGKIKSVCGAIPYEDKEYNKTMYKGLKSEIEEMINGPSPEKASYLSFAKDYTGKMNLPSENDHIQGNKNASVSIIEYSDFNCSYCNRFHGVLNQIIEENGNDIKWIFRHKPILGEESIAKAVAAECVTQIKNDQTFWKYAELMFGMQNAKNEKPSINEEL